ADQHKVGIAQPQVDEQDRHFGPPGAGKPGRRPAEQGLHGAVDHPQLGVEHAAPDQNGDQRRHGIGDDQQTADELFKWKAGVVEQHRNRQAQREVKQQAEDGEGEVPGDNAHQGAAQGRAGEKFSEVVEADHFDKARPELFAGGGGEGAAQVAVDRPGLLADHGVQLGVVNVQRLQLGGFVWGADLDRAAFFAEQDLGQISVGGGQDGVQPLVALDGYRD